MSETIQVDKDLRLENQRLLAELEDAYKSMEAMLAQHSHENKITYQELLLKVNALENLNKALTDKENKLINLQKMSSVGYFVANIIHELSTPLTIISGSAELARMKGCTPAVHDYLKVISESVVRLYDLLDRFRGIYGSETETFKVFDLGEHLRYTMETVSIIMPSHINLELTIPDRAIPVEGDSDQLMQIYLNICKNAFDELLNCGNSLSVKVITLPAKQLHEEFNDTYAFSQTSTDWRNIVSHHEQFAAVRFGDNGGGIAQERLHRVFEAYHTSKPEGEGTGLGLSISSDIITRHNGNLGVASEEGVGTEFVVLVPLASQSDGREKT
ncbi:MAG: sensor histidine kinase [Calditrichia bacterium]